MLRKVLCFSFGVLVPFLIINCQNSPTGPSANQDIVSPDIVSISAALPVTIDYSLTLDSMISLSNYHCYRPDFSDENFPVTGHGKANVNLQFMKFKDGTPDSSILKDVDEAGFRPGTLPEFLALGQSYPEEAKKITSEVGSLWVNNFPYIYWDEERSEVWMTMTWLDSKNGHWYATRLLVVRK